MKKQYLMGLLAVTFSLGMISCQDRNTATGEDAKATDLAADEENPVITFDVDSYDFGDIAKGEKVSYTFVFKNEGDVNLVIHSVTAGCGCTVPKWKKDPLPPDTEGYIEVVFDSTGRNGKQVKSVTVRSNGNPSVKTLQIQANIVEPNS
jgi:hypothetical protein